MTKELTSFINIKNGWKIIPPEERMDAILSLAGVDDECFHPLSDDLIETDKVNLVDESELNKEVL